MKKDDVPQDQSRSLAGQRKPLYVLDENGRYTTELSSGWDAEEVVLHQALEQFQQQAEDARRRAEAGQSSPLEYHMYTKRMDATVLAQSMGLFKWQVKRHFKPAVFCRLSSDKLSRYAYVLGLSVEALQQLPAVGVDADE
ncbi:hypothetical protein KOI40_01560 [Aestuariicella sp. G3-2]|uniref:hypothetical protein n=1 Tax=Pseudomaricurvus albidus TaxID=2842452 RepID=UPI001C0B939A|nr:hypothetical protein [Aestuariicella albida]MBU3068482.1 hypothetical protein [Aestuariicella albida]